MKRYLIPTLLISTCTIATQTMAYGLNDVANDVNAAANTVNAVQNNQTNIQNNNDRFTDQDRKKYNEYYNNESKYKKHDDDQGDNEGHSNKDHNNKKSLPPGLQKKVANGGQLPPGWQKKVDAGQVFGSDLRHYSKRSPYPSPKGTSTYILEDKVVRVLNSTNVILDVLTH